MSRISRYQESIEKFIKNKNIEEYFSPEYNKIITDGLNKSNHLGGIISSTIFNFNTKKSNISGHGYYIGIVIDIILFFLEMKTPSNDLNQNIIIGLYRLLNENMTLLKSNNSAELNITIVKTYEYFNKYIYTILSQQNKIQPKKMIKSDLLNLNTITDQLYKKISQMNRYPQEEYIEYLKTIYGNIGKLTVVLSWLLGGGSIDKKTLISLEKIGETYGMIYKICIDFDNIIQDINKCDTKNNITNNIVINIGIQESFVLFMDLKTTFYEESLKLNVYTHTMKEVIDELETKVDRCVDNTKVDMKSMYSSFSK